ncbi:MAG: hypothetical protein C0404_03560 [Verrucomicrobia bacterium]|nr:hypothetical protein [Verrucomicrobiota bacterium]
MLLIPLFNLSGQQQRGAIDWDRAQQLYRREKRGEKLTADEKEFLDHAKEARRTGGQEDARRPQGGRALPDTSELIPLTDMTGIDRYRGEDGGLYGGGTNTPPWRHAEAARKELAAIVPLNAEGRPATNGHIVLISIGMSNTTQEFSKFKEIADKDADRNPQVIIVDGAQGGMDATLWDVKSSDRALGVWRELDHRLTAAGVTTQQVQALWLKQAVRIAGKAGEFPEHARLLKDHLASILRTARGRYPNLRIAYLSSRTYGGYSSSGVNPEPYAYEGAFAVRWLIRAQMAEPVAADMNWDPARGKAQVPLLLWGPYLWANGMAPRKGDGLTYSREDFRKDGVHPSPETGQEKVAKQLLRFFKGDPLAQPWFVTPK